MDIKSLILFQGYFEKKRTFKDKKLKKKGYTLLLKMWLK